MEDEPFWRASRRHKRSKSHARYLGSLWTNLHSLETALRIALCEMERVPNLQDRLHALFEAAIGQTVDDDHFTRHNQLHDLIKAFNDVAVACGIRAIEPDIGELRHALAHGRVTAISEEHDIRLINFQRAKGGAPIVCYSAVMTPDWFKQQRKRVRDATMRVHAFVETTLPRSRPRQVIVVGSVTEEDVARVLESEKLAGAQSKPPLLVIVGSDVEGDLEQLLDAAKRVGRIVQV